MVETLDRYLDFEPWHSLIRSNRTRGLATRICGCATLWLDWVEVNSGSEQLLASRAARFAPLTLPT